MSLIQYCGSISGARYNPLSRKQETQLAQRIEAGDEQARAELVAACLRFVVSVVKLYRCNGISEDDLIQAGNIGLIQASKKFNWRRNIKFVSYAVWWIRQHIIREIERNAACAVPLDAYISGSDSVTVADTLPRYDSAMHDKNEMAGLIDVELSKIFPRERSVLIMYYGLDGGAKMTLDEIGAVIGCTRERVRQIRDAALEKIKDSKSAERLRDYL